MHKYKKCSSVLCGLGMDYFLNISITVNLDDEHGFNRNMQSPKLSITASLDEEGLSIFERVVVIFFDVGYLLGMLHFHQKPFFQT